MGSLGFEKLEVYRLAEKLSDRVWVQVSRWDRFAKDTVGKQIVRAVDSVGANIAEGSGRYNYKDNRRFVRMARASLYETHHWLRRACVRKLLAPAQVAELRPLVQELRPRLNAYLNSIGPPEATHPKDNSAPTNDK